jgi:hypothetical protein
MLVRDRKPPKAWATRLTAVFGTTEWETAFYSATTSASLLEPHERVETVYKSADYYGITEFFVRRLQKEFVEVSELLPLRNSTGSLLFMLFFAAGNQKSAEVGMKIANAIIGK